MVETSEDGLSANFSKYDADNSGNIDKDELKACLNDLGYFPDDEKLNKAYLTLDANQDGTIDYNEFRGWYLNG